MRFSLKGIALLLFCISAMSVEAQEDVTAIKQQINDIKRNTDEYLYAETTASSEDEAREITEEMLYEEINSWAAEEGLFADGNNLMVKSPKELWVSVSLPRGDMIRWFTYVKKDDIVAFSHKTENAADESESDESLASTYEVVETAAAPDVPEPVRRIADITEYTILAATIQQMKANGQITYYARYAQLDDPSRYYLAVYNTAGKVVAVLTDGAQRTNVRTGQSDDVKNYKGCGAIGFTVK